MSRLQYGTHPIFTQHNSKSFALIILNLWNNFSFVHSLSTLLLFWLLFQNKIYLFLHTFIVFKQLFLIFVCVSFYYFLHHYQIFFQIFNLVMILTYHFFYFVIVFILLFCQEFFFWFLKYHYFKLVFVSKKFFNCEDMFV